MAEPILRHCDPSPFPQKIRLAMGVKDLAWRSVSVEAVPPRPLLDILTGGLRRIPVLRTGADIYCDTEASFRAPERLRPEPTLHPDGEGAAKALSLWSDRTTCKPAIGILVRYIGDQSPGAFLKDRKEAYPGCDISKAAMDPRLPVFVQRMRAAVERLVSTPERNGPLLTGERVGAADLTCRHSLGLLRRNAGSDEIDRLLNLGDPSGLKPGRTVAVTPDANARTPVTGTLVAADAQRS